MAENDLPESPVQFSRVAGGPFQSITGRLGRHLLTLLLLLAFQTVSGSDQQAEQDTTGPEELISQALSDTPYINSLLIGREIPVLGGRWGWEMFVDVPLNDEPEGAEITLRRAKAAYARGFGNDWRIKLTADYTQGGGLQVSDTYASYSGWDRSLLTVGITDPPFSLESISQSSALTFMERGLPVVALAERRSGGVFVLRRSPNSIFNASVTIFWG